MPPLGRRLLLRCSPRPVWERSREARHSLPWCICALRPCSLSGGGWRRWVCRLANQVGHARSFYSTVTSLRRTSSISLLSKKKSESLCVCVCVRACVRMRAVCPLEGGHRLAFVRACVCVCVCENRTTRSRVGGTETDSGDRLRPPQGSHVAPRATHALCSFPPLRSRRPRGHQGSRESWRPCHAACCFRRPIPWGPPLVIPLRGKHGWLGRRLHAGVTVWVPPLRYHPSPLVFPKSVNASLLRLPPAP